MGQAMDTDISAEWPAKPGQPRQALRVAIDAEVLLRRASGNSNREGVAAIPLATPRTATIVAPMTHVIPVKIECRTCLGDGFLSHGTGRGTARCGACDGMKHLWVSPGEVRPSDVVIKR